MNDIGIKLVVKLFYNWTSLLIWYIWLIKYNYLLLIANSELNFLTENWLVNVIFCLQWWCNMQTYISNNERIVHLKPRPSITKSKSADLSPDSKYKETGIATRPKSGGTCEECGKHLQDERNRFCSITCKVTAMFRFNVYILWSTCISFVDSSHVQLLDLSASSGDPIPRSKSMFTKPPKC